MQNINELLGYYIEGLTNAYANYLVVENLRTEEGEIERKKRAGEVKYWYTLARIKLESIRDKLVINENDAKTITELANEIETSKEKEKEKQNLEKYITLITKIYIENMQSEILTTAAKELDKTGFI